jgi:DNA-binding transcriptional regulator LsrR (DeoR family)
MSRDLKYERENIELRRGKVLELNAQGYNQHDIAKKLNVSIGLVNSDIQHIRAQALDTLRVYINEKLPEEITKSLTLFDNIIKQACITADNTHDENVKIKALHLAREARNNKDSLVTSMDVVPKLMVMNSNNTNTKTNTKIEQSQTDQTEEQTDNELEEEEDFKL